MTQGEMRQVTDFMPLETDMILYLRDNKPVLHAPRNDGGLVPDDFLLLVAVAACWHDEGWRGMMMKKVQQMLADGALDSMVRPRDRRSH